MPDPSTPQASGRDLARQALAAYKTGRTPGQNTGPTRKRTRRVREDRAGGRDPLRLGTLLDRIAAEQAWTTSLEGGNIIDQWPTLCPQFVGKVQPLEFREDTGQLVVRPCSDAYGAQLRLLGGQLCKQINDKLGSIVVKSLGVMRVGEVTTPPTAAEPKSAAAPTGLVRTPETASPGYQRTRAVAREHKPDRTSLLTPAARAAIERQNEALRERREPEESFTEFVAQQERLEEQAGPPADSLEASIRAALAYKHSGGREPRRLFEAS